MSSVADKIQNLNSNPWQSVIDSQNKVNAMSTELMWGNVASAGFQTAAGILGMMIRADTADRQIQSAETVNKIQTAMAFDNINTQAAKNRARVDRTVERNETSQALAAARSQNTIAHARLDQQEKTDGLQQRLEAKFRNSYNYGTPAYS